MKFFSRTIFLLFLCASVRSAEAAKLTITTEGPVSGAVGVISPNSNVCNPNPGGGAGGGTCTFDYPAGTFLRVSADSPNAPGFFSDATGDAAGCVTSTCSFVINQDSFIRASFGVVPGPYPSVTMVLEGAGKGAVRSDNNTCQNWELNFSACTVYYAPGSLVTLEADSVAGNIFTGFSAAGGDASACGSSSPCVFTLNGSASIHAAFSPLTSVAVTPSSPTIGVGGAQFFSATGTFASATTRQLFGGLGRWTPRSPMAIARFSLAAVGLNDRVYAIGGVDGTCPPGPCQFHPLDAVERYDPAHSSLGTNDFWDTRAPMLTAREGLALVVANGQIYALGGHTIGGGAVASMEVYDPNANVWTALASMPTARAGLAAAVLNNVIYAVGGADLGSSFATVEAYDIASDTWTTKTPMTFARTGLAAAAVNGKLYAIAGSPNGGIVEEYDPAADAWTTKAPMPSGRSAVAAGAIDGVIYVVGGASGSVADSSVDVYNPALNAWTGLGTMPTPRGEFGLGVLDGRLFAIGGMDAGSVAQPDLQIFRPAEVIWSSSNPTVAPIALNSSNVHGNTTGTAMIRARSVGIPSGAQSATLTVNSGGGGGGQQIFLGLPNSVSAQAGNDIDRCGSFFFIAGTGTSASATVDFGDGSGVQTLPVAVPASGPCATGGGTPPTGSFALSHVYSTTGSFTITVVVTNTTTSHVQSGSVPVDVAENTGGGGDNGCLEVSTNITAGSVPFTMVHMAVFDRPTGQLLFEADVPLGATDLGSAPSGLYRVEFTLLPGSEGYTITPDQIEFDAVCGEPIVLTASIAPADSTAPSITVTVPADNAVFVTGSIVLADFACADGGSGVASCTGTVPSGSALDTATAGLHTFTVHATDNAGNPADVSVPYTVQAPSTARPIISGGPAKHNTVEATSADGAAFVYALPTATDGNGVPVPVNCAPASGSTFPQGRTHGVCTAIDASGRTSRLRFNVLVSDTTPPVFTTVPADLIAAATSPQGATVAYALPGAADIVDPSVTVTCRPASGHEFRIGTTTVTCTAKDASHNTATTSFTVTVSDHQAPLFVSVPSDLTVEATRPEGAQVVYPKPVATDEADLHVAVVCAPPSGSIFPAGTTLVTCTATDNAGNSATASFNVTVRDTTAPTVRIQKPDAAVYYVGQRVIANYSCKDDGLGIASCVGTGATGAAIDTSAPGTYTFTVNAADVAGNAAVTQSITYTVRTRP